MVLEKARRDTVGRAVCALGIALSALLSAGVCGAEQIAADNAAPRPAVQIEASQTQSPMDATMLRLRQFENVAGFDPAHLSAASRNLFSLADHWAVLRERLIKGTPASAQPAPSRVAGVVQASQILASNIRNSRYSGFTQSQTATRLVRRQRGDGLQ